MWGGVSQSFQAVSPPSERQMTSEPFVSHMLSRRWHAPVHIQAAKGLFLQRETWCMSGKRAGFLFISKACSLWESGRATRQHHFVWWVNQGEATPRPPTLQSLPRATALLREACVCAKSLQQYSTLCNPLDCSLPSSSVHGVLQENTGAGCHFLLQRIVPTQGSNLCLLHLPELAGRFFTTSAHNWILKICTSRSQSGTRFTAWP